VLSERIQQRKQSCVAIAQKTSIGISQLCLRGDPSGIGILTGVDQVPGHLSELDVEVLGGPTQNDEGRLRRDPLSLHQDPHGLADRLSAAQRGVEVGRPALLVLMGVGDRKSEAGHRDQYGGLGATVDAEGGGITRVQVERAHLCVRGQGKGQHAADPRIASEWSEVEPAQVPIEVVGVEDEPVGHGVETGPFATAVLQGVDLCDQRVGVHRGGDDIPFDQKDTGKITAFDSGHGQLDDAGQSPGDTAGREKDPGRLREGEGEFREGVPLGDLALFGNIQGVAPYSLRVGLSVHR